MGNCPRLALRGEGAEGSAAAAASSGRSCVRLPQEMQESLVRSSLEKVERSTGKGKGMKGTCCSPARGSDLSCVRKMQCGAAEIGVMLKAQCHLLTHGRRSDEPGRGSHL